MAVASGTQQTTRCVRSCAVFERWNSAASCVCILAQCSKRVQRLESRRRPVRWSGMRVCKCTLCACALACAFCVHVRQAHEWFPPSASKSWNLMKSRGYSKWAEDIVSREMRENFERKSFQQPWLARFVVPGRFVVTRNRWFAGVGERKTFICCTLLISQSRHTQL
ncbi:unnamed protein product [Toxocara canis]|uniref:Secreted protein n=1 Tax=Toxocara canis TaxID=6265 RepID=A0A183UJD6_TOXCA|nr:unnamed protein product [Toxocara canis]